MSTGFDIALLTFGVILPSGIFAQLREFIPQLSSGSPSHAFEGKIKNGYAVVISSVKSKEDAHRVGERAKSKGFKYKIFRSENGFFAVTIGWHLELKDAQALKHLAKQSGFDPYLHNFRTGTKWYEV